jgi:hypothetical protein
MTPLDGSGASSFSHMSKDATDVKKTILLALVLANCQMLLRSAEGAEVPAQYRGLWCDGSKGYYRCREATSESYLHIRRDRINLFEEADCRITGVMPIAKGHRLRVDCPPADLRPTHLNLRLDANGRLHRYGDKWQLVKEPPPP